MPLQAGSFLKYEPAGEVHSNRSSENAPSQSQ